MKNSVKLKKLLHLLKQYDKVCLFKKNDHCTALSTTECLISIEYIDALDCE